MRACARAYVCVCVLWRFSSTAKSKWFLDKLWVGFTDPGTFCSIREGLGSWCWSSLTLPGQRSKSKREEAAELGTLVWSAVTHVKSGLVTEFCLPLPHRGHSPLSITSVIISTATHWDDKTAQGLWNRSEERKDMTKNDLGKQKFVGTWL